MNRALCVSGRISWVCDQPGKHLEGITLIEIAQFPHERRSPTHQFVVDTQPRLGPASSCKPGPRRDRRILQFWKSTSRGLDETADMLSPQVLMGGFRR